MRWLWANGKLPMRPAPYFADGGPRLEYYVLPFELYFCFRTVWKSTNRCWRAGRRRKRSSHAVASSFTKTVALRRTTWPADYFKICRSMYRVLQFQNAGGSSVHLRVTWIIICAMRINIPIPWLSVAFSIHVEKYFHCYSHSIFLRLSVRPHPYKLLQDTTVKWRHWTVAPANQ